MVAYLSADARAGRLTTCRVMERGPVERFPLDVALKQFAAPVVQRVSTGGTFTDVGDESDTFARMLRLPDLGEPGELALRGIRVDGELRAVLALYEPRRAFGPRTVERFAPLAALFELAHGRFAEREARAEAVRTLEDVTQRVHGEYVSRLTQLEHQLTQVRDAAQQQGRRSRCSTSASWRGRPRTPGATRRAFVRSNIRSRPRWDSSSRRTSSCTGAARRCASARAPSTCSTVCWRWPPNRWIRAASPRGCWPSLATTCRRCGARFSCARRSQTCSTRRVAGLAPHIREGSRITIGHGVAGRVAATRKPLLVVDASDSQAQPLLRDEYLTTGSFISFPLLSRGELLGVVNLTNRAQRGLFVEEDVERVRLLSLVIALIAVEARLPELLLGRIRE